MSSTGISIALGCIVAILALGLAILLGRVLGRLIADRVDRLIVRFGLFAVLVAGFAVFSGPVSDVVVNLIWPPGTVELPDGGGVATAVLLPLYVGASVGAAMDNLAETVLFWAFLTLTFCVALGWKLFFVNQRKTSGS